MLEGRQVNLRIAERDDVSLLANWLNEVEFVGPYSDFPTQISKAQLEKQMSMYTNLVPVHEVFPVYENYKICRNLHISFRLFSRTIFQKS